MVQRSLTLLVGEKAVVNTFTSCQYSNSDFFRKALQQTHTANAVLNLYPLNLLPYLYFLPFNH